MWRPLLLLLSVSATVASKNDDVKEDFCNGQGDSDNLSEASVQFAISLYKTVTVLWARPPPNLFISPLSTYTSLAMLGLGAKSSTRQQILRAMCLSESEGRKILKEGYKNFLAELTSEEGNAEFGMSNWLFLDKSIKVSSKYKRYVARYYNASLQTIDFEDPQNAKQEINEQVNGQTDGKMEDLVNELDEQSNMVMVDYAKFIGKWKNPFSAAEKQHGHFRVNQVKTVEVDMMHKLGQYRTFKDDGTIMVEVPYTDQLVLMIIMPKNGNLSEVERTLSAQMIQSYLSKARTSLLDLYIPMISLEKKINVHFALLYMGISEVFGENADLSGISKHQKLKASMLYHKILFKLATEGTESSGAEITQGLTVPRAVDLRIDQPFFTMVYNKQLKTIMFMGRVRDPSREFSST